MPRIPIKTSGGDSGPLFFCPTKSEKFHVILKQIHGITSIHHICHTKKLGNTFVFYTSQATVSPFTSLW